MIEKTTSYKTSDGVFSASLEEAKKHELNRLVMDALDGFQATEVAADNEAKIAALITAKLLDNSEAVTDILTLGPKSRPGARKLNKARVSRAGKSVNREAA